MLKSNFLQNKTDKICKYEDCENTDFSLYHLVIFCFGQFMDDKIEIYYVCNFFNVCMFSVLY